jgi:hypothetical protein
MKNVNDDRGAAAARPTPEGAAKLENDTEKLEHDLEQHPHGIAAGAAGGAAAGAALGAIAGPPGMIVGALIGGAAGAAAGMAVDRGEAEASVEDAKLDEEIGVTDGDLGAPNLKHPPAVVGAYSAGSSGAPTSPERAPDEGPMPGSDSD